MMLARGYNCPNLRFCRFQRTGIATRTRGLLYIDQRSQIDYAGVGLVVSCRRK
jgi:hypothetical protein